MSERIPAEVFPPGEFLDDELTARVGRRRSLPRSLAAQPGL